MDDVADYLDFWADVPSKSWKNRRDCLIAKNLGMTVVASSQVSSFLAL